MIKPAVARFLDLPPTLPLPVRFTAFFYLSHLLVQGWIAPSEIFLLSALISGGVAVWKGQLRVPFHLLYYPLALYAAVSTLSAVISIRQVHLFFESALWIKLLIFPLALTLFRGVPETRRLAMLAFLFFGLYMSAWGLFQYFVLNQRDLEHRITGPAAHVMTYSGLLLPIALLYLILAFQEKKPWMAAGATLTALSLVLTFTRSVWVGYGAGIAALILMERSRWFLLAAPAGLWMVLLSPLSVFGRLMSTFDLRQSSNFDRLRMAQAGWEIIKDYPLFGVGPANVRELYPLYRRHDAPRFRVPHLHNNFVQIWAERGILGLTAYVLLLVLFLQDCLRAWRSSRDVMAACGMAVAIALTCAGLFEFNFGDTEVQLAELDLFALVLATIGTPLGVLTRLRPGRTGNPGVNGMPAGAVATV
jgi:O-antigen ligase